jgi:hypothetical protein
MEVEVKSRKVVAAGVLMALGSAGVLWGAEGASERGSEVAACRPLPKGQRILMVTFNPDTELLDVVGFYAALACKRVEAGGGLSKRKVTIPQQRRISLEELAQLVRSAAEKARVRYDENALTIQVDSL